MKRFLAFILMTILLLVNSAPVFACDKGQSDNRVCEILFGDEAALHSANNDAKMLMSAIYLCCEQSDKQGTDELNFLKKNKVSRLPQISDIDINSNELIECAHIRWEDTYPSKTKARDNRRKVLQNTVNEVFDFGFVDSVFKSNKGKCNSFAALLYYSHILADYLADSPDETTVYAKGKSIPAYFGQASTQINGGKPNFSAAQKKLTDSYAAYNQLDSLGRCGTAAAILGVDIMPPSDSRQSIGYIHPTGWDQTKYNGFVNSSPPYLYNRCHLIAHQLAGNDGRDNLITGTRYLNEEGMKPFEDMVAEYIRRTENHVVYRATPIFEGDNMVASGVQLEGYSVEDAGKGICFNVYCYNVQPGITINYATGKSEVADKIYQKEYAIPFAVSIPSDNNPDLIYEMNKHLKILFGDTKGASANKFKEMESDINSIAIAARSVGNLDDSAAKSYMKSKELEYKYYETLKQYVPELLKNEKFFNTTFK